MRTCNLFPAAAPARECEFPGVHCLAPPGDGAPLSRKAANKFAVARRRRCQMEVKGCRKWGAFASSLCDDPTPLIGLAVARHDMVAAMGGFRCSRCGHCATTVGRARAARTRCPVLPLGLLLSSQDRAVAALAWSCALAERFRASAVPRRIRPGGRRFTRAGGAPPPAPAVAPAAPAFVWRPHSSAWNGALLVASALSALTLVGSRAPRAAVRE